jgi:pSer/pThr/pTyr-binding forkhead associated (FHA) protein
MPTLCLTFEQKLIKDYYLGDETSLTIGRNKGNDVVIDNLGVSGHHAKVDCLNGRFLLTDLQSKNGTFVNAELIKSCWLEHGDVITIGKHVLVFKSIEGEASASGNGDLAEKTLVMDTDQYQAMLARSFSRAVPEEVDRETVGVLSFLAGGTGELKLTKKLTKIGRDAHNDIVVAGLFVGRTSATIGIRPSGYHLSYVGGFMKPKVNGQTVKQSVKLEDFDVIEVGSAKIQFLNKFMYKR